MNLGTMVTRGLNRAGLSVNDIKYRELAIDYLNEIFQEHWESEFWQFRKRALTLTTAASTEEYSLDKRVRVGAIVPNTMRGSDPVRKLRFEPSHDFYDRRPYALEGADPYYYRPGDYQGFSNNPSAASVITFASSLANYTTGTVNVVQGSKRVVFSGATITLDMLGRGFRVGSDARSYRLVKRDQGSSTIYYLDEPYEGTDDATASYAIGDVYQKASVLGYVSGQLKEEEVALNGDNAVSTTKSFTSIVRISKNGFTHGYVTATSNSGAVTNGILDPGETELDIQTVKLYPIPTKTETINYEAYIKHPYLYKQTDSPLFPSEFHPMLVIDLFIRLETEWNKRDVSEVVYARRDGMLTDMIHRNNNTDAWTIQTDDYEDSDKSRVTNLPASYPDYD